MALRERPAPADWRPITRRIPISAFGVVVTALVVVAHGYVAANWPIVDVVLAGVILFACCPWLCRALLIALALVGPTFNPPVLGIGGGRLYVVQALLVGVVIGGLSRALINGLHIQAATLAGAAGLFIALETVGRPSAGVGWAYRPLQVFLVAFAVRSLWRHRPDRPLVLALAWGSAVGCTLASIHALLPAFDPFAPSRPSDLPFVSAIGDYARATGAFTYPNNLGTFGAYTVLFGAAAWLVGRPVLPRKLALALMASGSSALVLAGSRAAGLGLLCGLVYLTAKAAPKRAGVLIAVEAAVGITIITLAFATPTGREVVEQRVSSATGESFYGRVEQWQETVEEFVRSPWVGIGATESNLDNFFILYATQAGIAGVVLLLVIARVALRSSEANAYSELWAALLLALVASGMLQDSLGQTLVTWFLGAMLGLCALTPARQDE